MHALRARVHPGPEELWRPSNHRENQSLIQIDVISIYLYIKLEFNHITVLHDVLLAFSTDFACRLG
jgi:hypothetical protein